MLMNSALLSIMFAFIKALFQLYLHQDEDLRGEALRVVAINLAEFLTLHFYLITYTAQ